MWRPFAPWFSVAIPVLVFGVLLAMTGEGWRWDQRQHEATVRHETELVAAQLAVRLEVFIATRLTVGAHLAHEWHEGEYKTEEAFAKESRFFHLSFPGIWAINWTDRHGIVRWVTPEILRKQIAGLDISTLPASFKAFTAAGRSGTPQVTPPFELATGQKGFVGFFPLRRGRTPAGAIAVVLRVSPIVEAAIRFKYLEHYNISIRDQDQAVYTRGAPVAENVHTAVRTIKVGNRAWRISLAPSPLHLAQNSYNWDKAFLLSIIILSAGLAWMVRLFLLRHAALRQSESDQRAIMQNTVDGIIVIDEAGVVISVNSAGCELFGYDSDEIVGNKVELLMPPAEGSRHGRYIGNYLTTGAKKIIGVGREVTGRRKDGSEFPLGLAIGEMTQSGGRRFIGTLRDLSETKRLEARLVQAQKMEAVGQLTGGIAHDFNNLLFVILGNLDLLLETARPGSSEKAKIEAALIATNRGAELTKQLLAFSRKHPLRPKDIDLGALVDNAVRMMKRTLGASVVISHRRNKKPWNARVDPSLFENAVLNLAINARDAMPDGGKLTLATENVEFDEPIETPHGAIPPGRYVRLEVRDTGTGMEPETLKSAFDPFFTTKEVGQGSGLGLSMVYGFVNQSSGHLTISSKVGAGTSIELYFPATDPKPGALADMAAPELPAGGRVLLVEDDPDARRYAVAMLEDLGFEVEVAEDGKGALAVLANGSAVDLLLTDLVSPGGMSGIEISTKARRLRADIKVLFMSGHPVRASGNGADSGDGAPVLKKPFRKEFLARAIGAALADSATEPARMVAP